MIDIHNHIIYEFDDGAKNLEMSLDMLKMAADQGITDVFATSHFNEVVHPEMEEDYFRKLDILRNETARLNLNLGLHSGSEIFFHHYIENTIKMRRTGTLAEKGLYALMEFPLYLMPNGVEETLFKLNTDGVIPIIAHPERYSALHERPEKILHFIRFGGLLQVNAGSLVGDFGRTVKKIAVWLVENRYVHFIGSDAHSTGGRCFKMDKAAQMLADIVPADYLDAIVRGNAQKILDNVRLEKLAVQEPETPKGFLSRMKEKIGIGVR